MRVIEAPGTADASQSRRKRYLSSSSLIRLLQGFQNRVLQCTAREQVFEHVKDSKQIEASLKELMLDRAYLRFHITVRILSTRYCINPGHTFDVTGAHCQGMMATTASAWYVRLAQVVRTAPMPARRKVPLGP